jgi:hypothetical protein
MSLDFPGDGINGLMESLRTHQDQIRFLQVRHEESPAFMACGYAKFTGKLGVCLATSGPGGLHLLNGLYDAKLDGQPVLAITGHHLWQPAPGDFAARGRFTERANEQSIQWWLTTHRGTLALAGLGLAALAGCALGWFPWRRDPGHRHLDGPENNLTLPRGPH